MTVRLFGSVRVVETVDSAKPVPLQFRLTNRGTEDLYILKWFTPLEGLDSDCLIVTRGARGRVAYDGPLIKRGRAERKDFVLLPAGQSLERTLDLSASYDVSRSADYRVQLNLNQLEFSVRPRTKGRSAQTRAITRRLETAELREGATAFGVGKAAGRAATRGQLARASFAELKPVPSARPRRVDGPLPPQIRGGTAAQIRELLLAHQAGFALCQKALGALANDSAYREWFGAHTERRRAKVHSVYTKIVQRLQSIHLVYHLEGRACRRRAFAYTFKDLSTIPPLIDRNPTESS
jgi:peptidyl-Lys metalloendopeptidase